MQSRLSWWKQLAKASLGPVLALLMGPAARGDEIARPRPPLPVTAEEVLNRYVAATGGKGAHAALQTLRIRGRVELADQPAATEIAMAAKRPNKLRVEQRVAGQITSVGAYDGQVGWSQDPANGVRRVEGEALADLRQEAIFNDLAEWRQAYRSVALVGTEQVNGRPCHVIELTIGGSIPPRKAYFDQERFLLCRLDSTQATPSGRLAVSTFFRSHQRFADVLMCVEYLQSTPRGVAVVTVSEIKVNEPLDDELFRMPPGPGPGPIPIPMPGPGDPRIQE